METTSSYRPRDWCVTPRLFGKTADVYWRAANGAAEVAQQAAARLQHGYALRIQMQLRKQSISVRGYCVAAERSYDRMLRVLNGQMVMKLEDVGIADVLLGGVTRLVLDDERSVARQEMGLKKLDPSPTPR